MTLDQLKEHIKKHLDSYGEGFIGEDELPEDFQLVDTEDWTQEGKYQHCFEVFKDPEGNYFGINNSRSGSYHTDWHYQEPYVSQLKRVEKTVVQVHWEVV